jgi:hypothetical protein
MTKAWCIWCETGDESNREYFWIHPDCFEKLMDWGSLASYVSKNKSALPSDFQEKWEELKDFQRRWEGSMKIVKGVLKK